MALKRQLADWLKYFPPLRWALSLGVRLFVPRHYVGAVGAIFNDAGQVLLVEHVFRPRYPWGLPGGWVERGENPADAVRREVEEELHLKVVVKRLLLCDLQGGGRQNPTPRGLGLVFYCRLLAGPSLADSLTGGNQSYEILTTRWLDPDRIPWELTPLEHKAISLAKQAFEQEALAIQLDGRAG